MLLPIQELSPIVGLRDTRWHLTTTAKMCSGQIPACEQAQRWSTAGVRDLDRPHSEGRADFFRLLLEGAPHTERLWRFERWSIKDQVWERWMPATGGLGSKHFRTYHNTSGLWQRTRSEVRASGHKKVD